MSTAKRPTVLTGWWGTYSVTPLPVRLGFGSSSVGIVTLTWDDHWPPRTPDSSEAPAQPWAGPVAALREGRVRPGLPARPDPDSSEAPT
jgi:hypothetical protein